jgi:hypothetical protein
MMKSILEALKDPYERKARVTPGLLLCLPIFVPLICVYGPKHPVLTSVVALLGGCGAVYGLASISRGLGKKLEEKLVDQWGGMPTTLMLRHRDNFLDSVSKRRYHEAIAAKLGIEVPTAAQEAADPASADDVYKGATRRLRELTRDDKKLLLMENIAYGFHRNMLALKPAGIVVCLFGIFYGLTISKALHVEPLAFSPVHLMDPGLPAALTLLIAIALLTAWVMYFNPHTVRRIAFVYAERLFECLINLPAGRAKARAPGAAKSPK